MRKRNKKNVTTLLLAFFCLSGCALSKSESQKTSDTPPPSEESSPTSSAIESKESEEGGVTSLESIDSTGSFDSGSASIEEKYLWSKEVDALLKVSLGEYMDILPPIEAERYEARNDYNKTYEITFTSIAAYGERISPSTPKFYSLGLELQGFSREYDENSGFYSCSKVVSYTTLVVAQIGYDEKSACLVMSAYAFPFLKDEFPFDKAYDFVKANIPDPGLPYYQSELTSMYGVPCLAIYGFPEEGETIAPSIGPDYCSILEDEGYEIDYSYASYGSYYAIDAKETFSIQFGLDLEEGYFLMVLVKL